MSQPLSESDILFPHQSNTPSFATTLSSLKRSALSINNRLTSITLDSKFVTSVAEAYTLPLVANERCGSWYIPLERKNDSVYFKSTDGHMGEWGFSLRRLNLQLLDVVNKYGGAIVVDSTRRGKSMPDALSKTIPIWCCVINRALFGADEKHELATPPQAVSKSEHAQIESRIDGCVRQFIVQTSLHVSSIIKLTNAGHMQTQYSGFTGEAPKATAPNLGDSIVNTTSISTFFHRISSHSTMYSITSSDRSRSIRERLCPRRR
jgi:tRNA A64-2'-O-ribosylphosphate transferase